MAPEPAVVRDRTRDAEEVRAAVEFRVDVVRERGAVRVCPVGEVDVCTIALVREHVDEAMAAGTGCLILDLRATTFLDSTALHLAVDSDAITAQKGIEFAIVPGPPAVQRTFDAAGLSARLPFVDVPRAG
jgi:anti-anti-sigma factor